LTVAEMVAELARAIGDVTPVTGQPAYRRYGQSAYLEMLRSAEDDLLMALPADDLLPLVVQTTLGYTDSANYVDLFDLTPPYRRLCVDGIYTDNIAAEQLTAERRSMVQGTSCFHDPYSLHAWFLQGGERIELWPISRSPSDTQAKHTVAFGYIRAANQMVVSNATGSQVMTSELPTKSHRLITNGAKVILYVTDGWTAEADRIVTAYEKGLERALKARGKSYAGGTIP
jgi:hypothetical protein